MLSRIRANCSHMGKPIQSAAIETVAKRFSATWHETKGAAGGYLKIADRRIAVDVLRSKSRTRPVEPRLRFDRVAVGLLARLQASVSRAVPEGRTVVLTLTAPIRKDSKTRAILEEKLLELLASRRASLKTTVHGNRAEVRVLKGGTPRTCKLLGFVHNSKPSSAILFDATRSLLARMRSRRRRLTEQRWLLIDNQEGASPLMTYQHVCSALRASVVFRRILVAGPGGRVTSLPRI